MYLSEVFFHGFKSFADPTRIKLGPGVSAIVGPNGCGKSNIADAIRWVLGEQSAKALRGGKMQDVIFSGTETRQAISVSEVALTFTDCEAELGSAFHEVEIARKVTLDGGGSYYINGKTCRLKDIQRLFMDTGIGRVSYSFLVQGQVDQILSSNPLERRIIFEEAAGITKYKSQRREALNKLALVDQNLSRVNDVIDEVGRQIGSLKRQASKALRYKKLKHRHTHLELAFFAFRHRCLSETLATLRSESEGWKQGVREGEEKLRLGEGGLSTAKAKRSDSFEQLREVQEQLYSLRSEKESAENQARFARMRGEDLDKRLQRLVTQAAELQRSLEEARRQSEEEAGHRQTHQDDLGSSDEVFQAHLAALRESETALAAAEEKVRRCRTQILELENAVTRKAQQRTHQEIELRSLAGRREDLESKRTELDDRRQSLNAAIEERSTLEAEIREAMVQLEREQGEIKEQAESSRKAFREATERTTETEREVGRIQARLHALQELEEKLEGYSDGTRALLKGELKEVAEAARFEPLLRKVKTDPQFIPAIEALLGEKIDLLLASDRSEAVAALEHLREKHLGRTCLQLPDAPLLAESNPALSDLPPGFHSALAVARVEGSPHQAVLHSLLQHCFVCPSITDALALLEREPEFRFEVIASLDGTILDRRHILMGGKGKGKGGGQMQRRNEIAGLSQQLAEAEIKVKSCRDEAARRFAENEAAEKEVERVREQWTEKSRELVSLESELKSLRQQAESSEREMESMIRQLAEIADRSEVAKKAHDQAIAEDDGARRELETARAGLAEAEEAVVQYRAVREEKRDAFANVRLEVAEKRQRLESLEKTLRAQELKIQELVDRHQQVRREQDQLESEKQATEAEEETSLERSRSLEESLQSVEESLKTRRTDLEAADREIETIETELQQLRQKHHQAETELNQREVRLAREQSQADFIREKVTSEHGVSIDAVNWQQELWEADKPFQSKINLDEIEEDALEPTVPQSRTDEPGEDDLAAMEETSWGEVEGEINQLRDRIHAIGAVNLVAIEEYADLRERHDFLQAQSTDLNRSKEELLRAVEEINQTSQSLFQQTFEQIRKNFQYTYGKLTDGGRADLSIAEEEDVLEAGIEIMARPPGTRLSQISLLSGGQRTMAAVSLLFAIYMVKPSPFCFLDELDAPLDDANIGRFTEMLKEFTRFSQFLIITHNKRTIASADAVFGVTMQEKGISKLVSMKFNHETQRAEFAEPVAG